MFVKLIRIVVGSVRVFMTIVTAACGLTVVFFDVRYSLNLGYPIYSFLTALVGYMAIFVWKDKERPAGVNLEPFAPASAPGGNQVSQAGGLDRSRGLE